MGTRRGGGGRSGIGGGNTDIANTRVPIDLIPDRVYVGMLEDWYMGFEGMKRKPVVEAGIVPAPKTQFTHGENRTDSVYVATTQGLAFSYANLYSRPLVLEIDVSKLDKRKFYYDPLDFGTLDNPTQLAYRGTIPPGAIIGFSRKRL